MIAVAIEPAPIAVGLLIGLLCARLVPRRLRTVAVTALAFPAGALVTWAAGELHVSVAFVVFDVGQVALAALATLGIAALGVPTLRGRGRDAERPREQPRPPAA